jgi:ankyrin repeat protein
MPKVRKIGRADLGMVDDDTDLHWACYDGNDSELLACLDEGFDANCASAVDGGTPLMRAAEGGHLGCAELCLRATGAANVNVADKVGRTALHFAWIAESGQQNGRQLCKQQKLHGL